MLFLFSRSISPSSSRCFAERAERDDHQVKFASMGAKDIQPIGNDRDTTFSLHKGKSPHKRSVMVSFDSFGVITSKDRSMVMHLILTDHHGTRASAELMR